MEAMRESWTDDRMDDLNGKVDALHLEMRTEFKAVRGEMREEFSSVRTEMREEFGAVRTEMREEFGAVRTEMKEEFGAVRSEMKAGFDKFDERFQSMDQRLLDIYRMMFGFCGLMLTTLIGLLATQL
jgi:predicted  nucleic acid-binding Zn-ribbon protein